MKTKYIDITTSSYDVMMLIATNIIQAIKCCAIIDAYNIIKDKGKFKNNDLYRDLIDCTYRDLLMCISRIYDDSSSCNINVYKKFLKKESEYSFSDEEKTIIFKKFKPLQKEYDSLYKRDRNKRLAHTDFGNFYNRYRNTYSYSQIRNFVIKTREVFDFILSIKNGYIPFGDMQELRDKYLILFK